MESIVKIGMGANYTSDILRNLENGRTNKTEVQKYFHIWQKAANNKLLDLPGAKVPNHYKKIQINKIRTSIDKSMADIWIKKPEAKITARLNVDSAVAVVAETLINLHVHNSSLHKGTAHKIGLDLFTFGNGIIHTYYNPNKKVRINGKDHYGFVEYERINPMNVMFSPNARDFKSADWFFVLETISISELRRRMGPNFDKHKHLFAKNDDSPLTSNNDNSTDFATTLGPKTYKENVIVYNYYQKDLNQEGQIVWHRTTFVDKKIIIDHRHNVQCHYRMVKENVLTDDAWGAPTIAYMINLNIAQNVLMTMIYNRTIYDAEPAVFYRADSGLNGKMLMMKGLRPGAAFPLAPTVNKISDAVSPLTKPQLPKEAPGLLEALNGFMGQVENETGFSSGTNSQSIQTKGGIEQMIAQSTRTNQIRIDLVENFWKEVFKDTLDIIKETIMPMEIKLYNEALMMEPVTQMVDENSLHADITEMDIDIKDTIENSVGMLDRTADMLMQLEMQYSKDQNPNRVPVITLPEYMEMKAMPEAIKKRFLTRYKEKTQNTRVEEIGQHMGAVVELVNAGYGMEEAIQQVAQKATEEEMQMAVGVQK